MACRRNSATAALCYPYFKFLRLSHKSPIILVFCFIIWNLDESGDSILQAPFFDRHSRVFGFFRAEVLSMLYKCNIMQPFQSQQLQAEHLSFALVVWLRAINIPIAWDSQSRSPNLLIVALLGKGEAWWGQYGFGSKPCRSGEHQNSW